MQEISHQGLDSASGTTLWKLVFEWTIWRQEVNVKLRIRELYGVAWCTSLQFAMFQICGTIQLHGTGTRPHTQTTSVVSTHAITTSSIPAINCKHQMFSIWIRIFKAVQRPNLDIIIVIFVPRTKCAENAFISLCTCLALNSYFSQDGCPGWAYHIIISLRWGTLQKLLIGVLRIIIYSRKED